MYESYWNLKDKPFENTPDPRFFFLSRQHNEILSRFMYVIEQRKQMAMFTGEYGSGKTLINMMMLSRYKDKLDYRIALIINPRLDLLDFLREIHYQLKKDTAVGMTKFEILNSLRDTILENSHLKKVIIIDEAQMIEDLNVFEELRLLSNLTFTNQFLTSIILVGQPQLKEKIYQIPQLRQRIALVHHLGHLAEDEVKEYVNYRLRAAGARYTIFTDEAMGFIFESTRGVPRLINTLCDISLAIGKAQGKSVVDKEIIEQVSGEIIKEINA
ncbi:MAG: AAA family ATPase [Candidatus Omnitrophica bacterium]|nr:AAA family ATPase [Candidatus Omnitrophota bacterium]